MHAGKSILFRGRGFCFCRDAFRGVNSPVECSERAASLMQTARLDAQRKRKPTTFPGLFANSGGTRVGSIVAAVCLFVAREFARASREPRRRDTQTHTQCTGTDDDVLPRCVAEPPQHYTLPGERSDSG